MELTKKQLDTIKNAKTKKEARKAYEAIARPAWEAYEAIKQPAYQVYEAIEQPAWEAYYAIVTPALKALENWQPPKPDYENMSKEELIKILKEKDEK